MKVGVQQRRGRQVNVELHETTRQRSAQPDLQKTKGVPPARFKLDLVHSCPLVGL